MSQNCWCLESQQAADSATLLQAKKRLAAKKKAASKGKTGSAALQAKAAAEAKARAAKKGKGKDKSAYNQVPKSSNPCVQGIMTGMTGLCHRCTTAYAWPHHETKDTGENECGDHA